MNRNFAIAVLALVFFASALFFWTYSWWTCDRAKSLLALQYCLVFWFGGILILILWRVTSLAPAR